MVYEVLIRNSDLFDFWRRQKFSGGDGLPLFFFLLSPLRLPNCGRSSSGDLFVGRVLLLLGRGLSFDSRIDCFFQAFSILFLENNGGLSSG